MNTTPTSVPEALVEWASALDAMVERGRAYLMAAKTWLSAGGEREDEDTPAAGAMRTALAAMDEARERFNAAQTAAEQVPPESLRTPAALVLLGRVAIQLMHLTGFEAEMRKIRVAVQAERN